MHYSIKVDASMNQIIPQNQNNNQESPFDQIRRFTEDGQEYWLARELMELLGYKQWRRFSYVIDIAKENLETVTKELVKHFLPLEAKIKNSNNTKGSGRKGLDYQLSRLAAYHVALSCDSRGKESVKLAKHYFAIKTREAEIIVPAQNDRIRELELENKLHKQKQLAQAERKMILDSYPEYKALLILGAEKVEKIEYRDRQFLEEDLINDGSGLTQRDLCYHLGFVKNNKPQLSRLKKFFAESGIDKDESFWTKNRSVITNRQIRKEKLEEIEELHNRSVRQMFLGE